MKKSLLLRQQLEDAVTKQGELLDLAKNEGGRAFTDVEQSSFDGLESEITKISDDIKRAEVIENAEMRNAELRGAKEKLSPEAKVAKNYSFLSMINDASRGKPMDGLVREMHEEALKESRESGVNISGIGIPSFLIDYRTMLTSGVAATAGNTVPTNLQGYIPALRPQLKVVGLGATIYDNLYGNVKIPRNLGGTAATWEDENSDGAESNDTFDQISLDPHRVGLFTDLSKLLLRQSSIGVEADVRNAMSFAIAKAVDTAALYGTNANGQPKGLTGYTINSVTHGADGANPTWGTIIDLETAVAVDNADVGRLAYLTTPGMRGFLKQTPIVTGTNDRMIWNDGMLNGYRAEVSTQIKADGTKGNGTALHSIFFGAWDQLIIANWGGLDILVDPYTQGLKHAVRVYINSWWDIGVKQENAFALASDCSIVVSP